MRQCTFNVRDSKFSVQYSILFIEVYHAVYISVSWKFSYVYFKKYILKRGTDAHISLPFSVLNPKADEILCCRTYDLLCLSRKKGRK